MTGVGRTSPTCPSPNQFQRFIHLYTTTHLKAIKGHVDVPGGWTTISAASNLFFCATLKPRYICFLFSCACCFRSQDRFIYLSLFRYPVLFSFHPLVSNLAMFSLFIASCLVWADVCCLTTLVLSRDVCPILTSPWLMFVLVWIVFYYLFGELILSRGRMCFFW